MTRTRGAIGRMRGYGRTDAVWARGWAAFASEFNRSESARSFLSIHETTMHVRWPDGSTNSWPVLDGGWRLYRYGRDMVGIGRAAA